MSSLRFDEVRCLGPAGFHFMRWTEWGEVDNPRLLVCVHGLTRVGRDFDDLARAMAPDFRVVCPDVVGRGRSDWLRQPMAYGIPQYVNDMAMMFARLNAQSIAWVGTSLGGLIGMALAGQAGSPISRLLLNDVGPTIDAAALARIGDYLGRMQHFADLEQATDYVTSISKPFGLTSRAQWRAITESVVVRDGEGYRLHYDPQIAIPFKQANPETAAAGEAALWALYDAITAPTLLVRGENSDLLSRSTAALMTTRGPKAALVEIAGVGHAPMFMDPHQINIARQFLLGA